jgi:hypothetical protein
MPRTERASRSAARDSSYALREPKATVTASPYTPIDSENSEIRLLELAPGKFEDDIEICLVPANLNDDPSTQYEALSYVWGTKVSSRRALLNGIPVAITQNLDCALRYLRMKIVTRLLWADALSMNQQDTQERNHQVQIMGKIYSTASGVIVWLGPVEQSDIHMRAILGAMQFHFSDSNSAVTSLFDYVCSVVGLMNEQVANPMEPRECVLDTLFRIIDCPWFGRIWVVQELALSKTATIRIGHYSIPWIPFQQFFQWLPHHKADPETRTTLVSACNRVFKVASSDHFDSQLRRTLHLAATDPRDKVYSILGISEFSDAPIRPDYGKSTRMVYSEAVACLLREKRLMLYFATKLQAETVLDKAMYLPSWTMPLPSWVPDLRVATGNGTESTVASGSMSDYNYSMDILEVSTLPFTWTGTIRESLEWMCGRIRFPLARFSFNFGTLFAPGVFIAKVTETSSNLMNYAAESTAHAYMPREVCDFYQLVVKPRGIAPDKFIKALLKAESLFSNSEFMEIMCTTLNYTSWSTASTSTRNQVKHVCARIRTKVQSKTLFVTDKGQVGVSYHPDYVNGIRTGDMVVGLFGVNFPFILRQNDNDTYQMINVARITDVVWGHEFLRNTREHVRMPPLYPEGKSWEDYQLYGMREYAIV